ncbi:hypothetical protein DXG01_011271, partial [Tephrocybe rancida]
LILTKHLQKPAWIYGVDSQSTAYTHQGPAKISLDMSCAPYPTPNCSLRHISLPIHRYETAHTTNPSPPSPVSSNML